MRNLFTLLFAAAFSASLFGQQLVQVKDIRTIHADSLIACNDQPELFEDTVKVVCYVVTSGNLSEVVSSSINGANGTRPFIWVNDTANGGAVGPYSGMEIMGVNWNTSQATSGFTSLIAGDLVEITGVVGYYNGATQFQPLNNNSINILTGNSPSFTPQRVKVGELNDQNQVNNLVTGEKWEGAFIEVRNVTVTNVNQFGSGVTARVEFTVADSVGNSMQIYDFFLAQKLSSWTAQNPNSPATAGAFAPPSVGTFFNSIKGVVEHSGNGCTGGTGQGYRIQPFDASHYDVGKAVPTISNAGSTPTVPPSNTPIVINADVIDSDGSVDSVNIFWSANASTPISGFTKAAMTLSSGITYTHSIPGQPNGTNIRYYIVATDNDTASAFFPRTAAGQPINTASIFVRDAGLSIVDVQTPFGTSTDSPFDGQKVTLKGFVTASQRQCDLGYVYIQDSAATEYAGLALRSSLDLANLYRNEYVRVSGTIQESFGFTQMLIDSIKSLGSSYEIQPVVLDPSDAAALADYEKYESMLVKYQSPTTGGKIYIANPDAGFGEYTLSSVQNTTNTDEQRRVLAGRAAGTNAQSSLYVQLVSDSSYATNDGTMFFTPIEAHDSITMDAMTGILWYSFSNFKLLPRNNNDIEGLSVQLDPAGCMPPFFSISENMASNVVLDLYPNPATNQVTISGFEGEATVSIFDLKGTLIKTASANEAVVLNVNDVKAGLYIVKVTGNSSELYGTYKLMITQ